MKMLICMLTLVLLTGCQQIETYNTRTWVKREVVDATGRSCAWVKKTTITVRRSVEYYPVYSPPREAELQEGRKKMLADEEMEKCIQEFKEYLINRGVGDDG